MYFNVENFNAFNIDVDRSDVDLVKLCVCVLPLYHRTKKKYKIKYNKIIM